LNIDRMPPITSLARRPSLATRFRAARASSRSGVAGASQRKPALAFATIAAKGWFISWAIEAAISPIAIIWVTRASSTRAKSSALRSVMSRKQPTNKMLSPS
jgi:hypothetical protein